MTPILLSSRQLIPKALILLSFHSDLGDKQIVCKVGPKNVDARTQVEKGKHTQDTFNAIPG